MSNATSYYPGQDLGLPETGWGSIARPGPRIAALIVDGIPCALIAWAFFNYDTVATALIFLAVNIVFIPTLGGTPGHRIVGMRVVRTDGAWTGVWRPVVRSVLLALLLPAVVWDQDQRGLHDKAAGTMLVRSRALFNFKK